MRFSQSPLQTLREDPADAEVPSHRLLARAGLIQRLAAGLYIYSPLMLRTIRKVAKIVREEMERSGAQELLMPIMQPKDIWVESGRWERYIKDGIMFHMTDKKGSEMCLGPTHEEVAVTYIKKIVKSHKQLPLNIFQIQNKFRDEIRPRFGLMRGREFMMKDAYSFDVDTDGLDRSYVAMDKVYRAIFERCGLQFTAVEADSGAIGGSGSQEFMVTADTGEDAIIVCDSCDYAANIETATSIPAAAPASASASASAPPLPMVSHHTPNIRSVKQLMEFFKKPATTMAKTVLYSVEFEKEEAIVAVMMRGDLDINEVKLQGALGALRVELADEAQVKDTTGAEVGFAGPIGLKEGTRVLADLTLQGMNNLLVGACTTDHHNLNVNVGRDFPEPQWHDLRNAQIDELCARCKTGHLQTTRGIEVGHIFKLGTKYSEAMQANFTGTDGKLKPMQMGCYGIGVSRTAAAAVEQHHDEKGILWPLPIAPFEVVLGVLNVNKDEQRELAETLYKDLQGAGIDICYDDRKMSPGAKFKDLDLIGIPVRVIVGRGAADGMVEVSTRKTQERADVSVADLKSYLENMLK